MNARRLAGLLRLLLLPLILAGCGRHTDADHGHGHGHDHDHEPGKASAASEKHDPDQERDHDHDHDHDHGEAASAGATFVAGRGVMLADATRRSVGLEVVEVQERSLPNLLRFTSQIFSEQHRHLPEVADHSGCDVHGAGFVATDSASAVRPGQAVELLKTSGPPLAGVVLAVQKAVALGETEVVFGVSNATAALKPGEFVPARLHLPGRGGVPAVPRSAVLRTSEGAFAYAVRDQAYRRTAVKTGAEAEGWVEVTDGLRVGEVVVVQPVQTLWLIELRATKGGGHSH